MSYKVIENNLNYDIIETSTDTVIKVNYIEKTARECCRKLNLGGGFNGWTPSFFANSTRNS